MIVSSGFPFSSQYNTCSASCRRIWYSDETKSKRFFNIRELQRHESKRKITENDKLMKLFKSFEENRSIYINELIRKYQSIFDKYHFLFELIQIAYPLLFQAIKSSFVEHISSNTL